MLKVFCVLLTQGLRQAKLNTSMIETRTCAFANVIEVNLRKPTPMMSQYIPVRVKDVFCLNANRLLLIAYCAHNPRNNNQGVT